jgi:hypothetical protein
MQVAMWGILLCTIGVAALASQYKRGASSVKLGDPQLLDSVTVRIPKGWKFTDDGRDGLRAVERGGDMWSKRTLVVRERDPDEMSMLERWVSGATNAPAPKRPRGTSQIKMGPVTGWVTIVRDGAEFGRSMVPEVHVTAMATLPNNHVLTIAVSSYDIEGTNDDDAMEVLKLVAGSVEFIPPKEMKSLGR